MNKIRPGTMGAGINIAFKVDSSNGVGSLFRIENLSPFPIWMAQDGILANPSRNDSHFKGPFMNTNFDNSMTSKSVAQQSPSEEESRNSQINGDMIHSMECVSFGLDVPFRQGKYIGRKAIPLSELLRLRCSLCPLSSRDGIESTKVVGLTEVGAFIRLSPSKLHDSLPSDILKKLLDIKVIGLVCTDGPTRVLRFR